MFALLKRKKKGAGAPPKEENLFERYRLKVTEEQQKARDNKAIFGIFENTEAHMAFLEEYRRESGANVRIVETLEELEEVYDITEYREIELAAYEKNDRRMIEQLEVMKANYAVIAKEKATGEKTLVMAYPSAEVMAAFDFEKIAFMTYQVTNALWSVRSLDFLEEGGETGAGIGMEFLDKIFLFMEKERITDLHMRKDSPYTYTITGRRFSGVEQLQDRPIPLTAANAIIRALMTKAAQDPFSEKPEIRGLISEKVLGENGLIDRNYRLHIQHQTVRNKNNPSVSLRRLANAEELERLGFKGLGYHDDAIELIRHTIETYKTGAVIVSGATNSGKSTLLYTIFVEMNKRYGKRIMTIENPIEIDLVKYLDQFDLKTTENADEEHRMTKEMMMAAFLSHDPDVTAINEVRYNEEIEAFIDMSLQSHIAFTTLHANDVETTVKRMLKSGAPIEDVVSTLRLVINQELLDKRCRECAGTGVRNGNRCVTCRGKGIVGRLPLYEIALFKKGIDPEDNLIDLAGLRQQNKIEYISKVEIIQRYRKEGSCFDKDYTRVMRDENIPKEEWIDDPLAEIFDEVR